jgi:hypothetical protein
MSVTKAVVSVDDGDQTFADLSITLDVEALVEEIGFSDFTAGSHIYIDQIDDQLVISFTVHNDDPPEPRDDPREEALTAIERDPSLCR